MKKVFPAGSSYIDTEYHYDGWRVVEEWTPIINDLHRQFVYGAFIDEPIVMDVDTDGDGSEEHIFALRKQDIIAVR